ncbi:hypothetical protein [Neolewinella sp.]|uniref:hypothetical protein n=1 Tax=Neolewinella sp. TaxID=2993543 RepID=UPI003B52A993
MKYVLPLLLSMMFACSDRPPTTPETRPVENPNAGNTAIYDVDADDPYEIGDGSFLDMRPGAATADFSGLLRADRSSGDKGGRPVHQIVGRNDEELGYLYTEADDGERIDYIVITSPDVVTEDGIRVGNSYAELVERLGEVEVQRGADTSLIYVTQGALRYGLNLANNQYDPARTDIDPTTAITQIEIH